MNIGPFTSLDRAAISFEFTEVWNLGSIHAPQNSFASLSTRKSISTREGQNKSLKVLGTRSKPSNPLSWNPPDVPTRIESDGKGAEKDAIACKTYGSHRSNAQYR